MSSPTAHSAKKRLEAHTIPSGEAGDIVEGILTGGYGITYGHKIGFAVTKASTIYFERVVDGKRHRNASENSFWAQRLQSISTFLVDLRGLTGLEIDTSKADEYIISKHCCRYDCPPEDHTSAQKRCVRQSYGEMSGLRDE